MTTNEEPIAEERLVWGYTGRTLIVLSVGAVASLAGRLVIPAVLPTIIEEFSITPSKAGFALTLMVVAIALSQYFGGRLSDQLSRKTVLVAALALYITAFAVVALSPTYLLFLAGSALLGLGNGFYFPSTMAQISDLFRERRGQAFGVVIASFSLGSAIAPGLAVVALALGTWRTALLPPALVLAAVLLAVHFLNRGSYVVGWVDPDFRGTARRLLGSSSIRRSLIVFAFAAFAWQGGINFVPTFLQVERGFSPSVASATFAGLFAAGMVTTLLAGNLGDRFGYLVVAILGLVTGLVGLSSLLAFEGTVPVIAGTLLFGGGISAVWPVMNAHVMNRFPDGSMGGDLGALTATTLAIGSVSPTYVGVVAERIGYPTAFAGLVACLIAAIVTLLWLMRLGPADVEHADQTPVE